MAQWNAFYQNEDDDDEDEQEEGEQFRGKFVNLFISTFIFGIISVILPVLDYFFSSKYFNVLIWFELNLIPKKSFSTQTKNSLSIRRLQGHGERQFGVSGWCIQRNVCQRRRWPALQLWPHHAGKIAMNCHRCMFYNVFVNYYMVSSLFRFQTSYLQFSKFF